MPQVREEGTPGERWDIFSRLAGPAGHACPPADPPTVLPLDLRNQGDRPMRKGVPGQVEELP